MLNIIYRLDYYTYYYTHTCIRMTTQVALRCVASDLNLDLARLPSGGDGAQQKILGDILISSSADGFSEETLCAVDRAMSEVKARSDEKELEIGDLSSSLAATLKTKGTSMLLWRGDITKLKVGAIVNAANDAGLGCFIPSHRCIDNVIHRGAGPRLRKECSEKMKARSSPLSAGTRPIITQAYHLPCDFVLHVTGPRIRRNAAPSVKQKKQLADCYTKCLNACVAHGIRTVAFPCISTGLFGYPPHEAARVAMSAVTSWIAANEAGAIDAILFDVFTDNDENIYCGVFGALEPAIADYVDRTSTVENAARLIHAADAILVVAGAGMSVTEGRNVYVNRKDFQRYYGGFAIEKYGYGTMYEAMASFYDARVPLEVYWGLYATHMHYQRYAFEPNEAYAYMKSIVSGKDTFVLTSNVDGCFERAGFDKENIYTPQGDWAYYQCREPCRADAVFETKRWLERAIAHVSSDGKLDSAYIPKCHYCGNDVWGNVRGGSWFTHEKYEACNSKLEKWIDSTIASGKRLCVVEVGAGMNTPTVTRFPAEMIASRSGAGFVRINPDHPQTSSGTPYTVAIAKGWQVLVDISASMKALASSSESADKEIGAALPKPAPLVNEKWRMLLRRLRNDI